MKTILYYTIFMFGFFLTIRGQNFKKDFYGVPLTCVTDSTSITVDSMINLKRAVPSGIEPNPKCPRFRYKKCEDIPTYIEFVNFWPTQIILNFKKKTYFFLHSPHPTDPNVKYGEKGFTVTYSYDIGKLTIDKKKKRLTLTSTKHSWTRTFDMTYSSEDDVLTLRNKNGY